MIPIPINVRGILAISVIIVIGAVWHIKANTKSRTEYQRITSEINYLGKTLGKMPHRNIGKYRYLQLAGYVYPFEMFIGNDVGDFKPKYEQIDRLRIGDTITVYYYETDNTRDEQVNRFVQFIENDGTIYYERGNSARSVGIILIVLCLVLDIGSIILWKLKKIGF